MSITWLFEAKCSEKTSLTSHQNREHQLVSEATESKKASERYATAIQGSPGAESSTVSAVREPVVAVVDARTLPGKLDGSPMRPPLRSARGSPARGASEAAEDSASEESGDTDGGSGGPK